MYIDWGALGEVFGVSLLATVVLVGLFTAGIVGGGTRRADGSVHTPARVGAYACYALCAGAVGFGIWLIAA
ncbi:hypothetical protein [Streptomyces sulphureus]|uniref:hypothetical protein n=1 Tax=Streptomyces sulphureus TaxID=47758 RepID=UPI00035DB8B5|nr:hypothetical protein [Streptomyces sulphureus]